MKIFDPPEQPGHPGTFEIECSSISHAGVLKVLRAIPGLVVTRVRPWYGLGEYFCDFELAESAFHARGPTDAVSRFWFGPVANDGGPGLEAVRAAFARHSVSRWMSPLRIGSISAIGFSPCLLTLSLLVPPDSGINLIAIGAAALLVAGVLVAWKVSVVMRDGNATCSRPA